MSKIILTLLFSSILFADIGINVIESESEINIELTNLNELGTGLASPFEHPPISKDSLFGLSFPLAIDFSEQEIIFDSSDFSIDSFDKGTYRGTSQTLVTIFPKNENHPDSFKFSIKLNTIYPLGNKIDVPGRLRKNLNQKQLYHQLAQPRKTTPKNSLQDNFLSWMKDETNYLKIGTDQVGISQISGSEIIPFLGNNKNINNIHILRNGEEYKHFYIRSDDDILSSNDNLYLLSTHQYGDSTFYEHHTDMAYFYIYYDESSQSEMLSFQSNEKPASQDDYILQEYHHEINIEYSFGAAPWEIGSNNYEGWFERVIAPLNGNDSEHSVYLDLFMADNTQVQVSANYSRNYFLTGPEAPWNNVFNVDFDLNNITVHNTGDYTVDAFSELSEFWKSTYNYRSSDHDLVSGPNKFTLRSNFVRDEDASRIGVDFFNVRQAGTALARNGIAKVEKINSGKAFSNIYNFNTNQIVAIDTANGFIHFPISEKSNVLQGGITDAFVGLKVDDFTYHGDIDSDNSGFFHYITRNINSNEYKSGSSNSASDLNELLESDFISIATNRNISSNLLNIINSKLGVSLSESQRNLILAGPNSEIQTFSSENSASGNLITSGSQSDKFQASVIFENSDANLLVVDSDNFTSHYIEGLRSKTNTLYEQSSDEVIAIYYKDLEGYAQSWKEYRESQGFSVRIIDVEVIFDEFGYGMKSPHAIKDYLKYAKNTWGIESLEYVYLIGDASWDPKQQLDNSISLDQIPVYGRPYSDMWYAMLDDNSARRFDISVTRLSAKTNSEAMSYLQKVQDFESLPPREWFKDFLLLIGGYDHERVGLKSYSDGITQGIVDSEMRIDTTIYLKQSSDAIETQDGNIILKTINQGVLWTNFLGHGAFNAVDIGGWEPSRLTNVKRTGVLSTVSCNNGAFAEPLGHRSRNEDQLLVPESGFVGVFGGTATGNAEDNSFIMQRMFTFFEDQQFALRRLSDILYLSLDDFFPNTSLDFFTLTYNYLGDPLIELPLSTKEDYLFLEETETIFASDGSNLVDVEDEFTTFSIKPFNLGYHLTNPEIIAVHTYQNVSNTFEIGKYDFLQSGIISLDIPTKEMPGDHFLKIIIDNQNISEDEDFSNNTFQTSFEVFDKNLIPFDPQTNWNLSESNKMRFFNPFFSSSVEVEGEIIDEFGNNINDNFTIEVNSQIVDFDNLNLKSDENYTIRYRSKLENDWSAFNEVKFNTFESSPNSVNYNLLDIRENNNLLRMASNNEAIYFDTSYREYEIKSLNGIETTHAGVDFNLDGERLLQFFGDGYLIATYSKYDKIDKPKVRHFNTLGWFYPPDVPAYYIDSLNFRLVEYLRDSIDKDDYIMLATAGNSARQFEIYCNDNFCHKDTLVEAIESIGIEGFTKENIDIELGMAYFGGLDIKESLKQQMITRKVLAELQGNAPIFNLKGEIASDLIGPAKKWHHIEIEDSGNANILFEISDIDGNILDTIAATSDKISLESYNEQYLKFKAIFSRENEKQYYELSKLFVNFTPVPEIGLIEAETDQDSVLRGDSFEYNFSARNYSLRSQIEKPIFAISVNGETNNIDTLNQVIMPNSIENIRSGLDTRALFTSNSLVLDSKTNEDLFQFNNSVGLNFQLIEDTENPEIILLADGTVAKDGDFVSKSSELFIELYDNSRLAIQDFNNFSILRFNGFLNENELNLETDFDHEQTGGLKARFRLPNDRIQLGENRANLIQIVASDASNNIDSLFIYLNVAENGKVLNQINYPNPFVGATTFKFDLLAPEITDETKAQIQIYDGYGKKIRTLESGVNVGENEIAWDGLDSRGNSIPSGRYYYMIMIMSDFYFPETDAGISIKIK